MGSQRVGHDRVTNTHTHTHTHRKYCTGKAVVVKTKGIQKLKREQRWGSGSLCPHKELGPPVFPLVGQKDKMITEIYLFLKAVILYVTHFMETLASVAQ